MEAISKLRELGCDPAACWLSCASWSNKPKWMGGPGEPRDGKRRGGTLYRSKERSSSSSIIIILILLIKKP